MADWQARNRKRNLVWLILAGSVFLFGVGLAAVGIFQRVTDVRPAQYVSSTGTIDRVDELETKDGSSTYYHTAIEFSTPEGDHYFESRHGISTTRRGDTVTVWYDPADPAATAETAFDRSASIPGALLVGPFVAIAGIGLWMWRMGWLKGFFEE